MTYQPVPISGANGVNLIDDPTELPTGEVISCKNHYPAKKGKLSKRPGLSRPIRLCTVPFGIPSNAIMSPLLRSVADLVVAERNLTDKIVYLDGVALNGSTLLSFPLPFDHMRLPLMVWAGKIYALPGPYADWRASVAVPTSSGPSRYPYYVYDLSTEVAGSVSGLAFTGTGNENVFPTLGVPYKQRLVLMNFGNGFENTILFTNNYSAIIIGNDVLALNGRAINLVAVPDGDEIVAGAEMMLTGVGSPSEAAFLVLRRNGNPFLLTGEPEQLDGSLAPTGTSTLDSKRISLDTGCAGQPTVARTPYGIVWAGPDDVWIFRAGALPVNVGLKIRPALKQTPASLQYRWTGVYHDGFYRLAVWGEGQPMDQTDAPGDQWWLDLRDGPPQSWKDAKWYGPQQFLGGASAGIAPRPQTWGLLTEKRTGKDSKLYYIDRVETAAATFSGVVGEYGSTNGRDMTAMEAYIADKDYVDPEIVAEIVTKEYDVAPGYEKGTDGVRFTVRPDNDLGLELDIVTDAGDQSQTVDKQINPGQFRANIDVLDTGLATNTKPISVSMYAEAGNRPVGQTFQYRIRDVAGYSIVEDYNDLFFISPENYQITPNQRYIQIPEGVYSFSELVSAIAAGLLLDADGVSHGTLANNDTGESITTKITAGKIVFDDSANITQQALTLNVVNNNFVANAFATTEQLLRCKRLCALLGLNTDQSQNITGDGSSGGGGVATVSIVGDFAPFKKGVANYDIWGIQANIEVYPREP